MVAGAAAIGFMPNAHVTTAANFFIEIRPGGQVLGAVVAGVVFQLLK